MSETPTNCVAYADVIYTSCLNIVLLVSLFSPPDRTVILSPPQALKRQPGTTATFTCLARVDPSLGFPLIQWRKNDQKLFESHSDEK